VKKKPRKIMKTLKIVIHLIFSFFLTISVFGEAKSIDSYRRKIEENNKQIAKVFVDKNIEILINHFDEGAICMPEFQPSMKGTLAIKEFYRGIINRRQTISFNKIISETIQLKNNIVEIGTFTTNYLDSEGIKTTLNGKYLNIWVLQSNRDLKLKAESFGYLHRVENPTMHLVKLSNEYSAYKFSQRVETSNDLSFQLLALNTLMEKSVRMRDGNLRTEFFTDDAIFMPFSDSSKVGIKSIRKHLIDYNSYPVKIDSIAIYNEYIEDCTNYVIEYPRFYVKWHTSDNSGVGSGKGIRIWRREKNCSLKLYREIGIHDHIE
jgi:ketosteroid isomerase-like protein